MSNLVLLFSGGIVLFVSFVRTCTYKIALVIVYGIGLHGVDCRGSIDPRLLLFCVGHFADILLVSSKNNQNKMSKLSRIEIRVEKELKEKVLLILQERGLTLSKAVYLYLKMIYEKGELPFEMPGKGSKRIKSSQEEAALTLEEFSRYIDDIIAD